MLAEFLPSPVVDLRVRLTFEIDLAVASTSRPECRFSCILASQIDTEEDRKRRRKGNIHMIMWGTAGYHNIRAGSYQLDLLVHIRRWRVFTGLAILGRRWRRTWEEFTSLAAFLLAVLLSACDAVFVLLNEGGTASIFGDVVP